MFSKTNRYITVTYSIIDGNSKARRFTMSRTRLMIVLIFCSAFCLYSVAQIATHFYDNIPLLQTTYYKSLTVAANFLSSIAEKKLSSSTNGNEDSEFYSQNLEDKSDIMALQEEFKFQPKNNESSSDDGVKKNDVPMPGVNKEGAGVDLDVAQNKVSAKMESVSKKHSKEIEDKNGESIGKNPTSEVGSIKAKESDKIVETAAPDSSLANSVLIKLNETKHSAEGLSIILELKALSAKTPVKGQYFTIVKSFSKELSSKPTYFVITANGVKGFSELRAASHNTIKSHLKINAKKTKKLEINLSSFPKKQENLVLFFIYMPDNEPIIAKSFLIKSSQAAIEVDLNEEVL